MLHERPQQRDSLSSSRPLPVCWLPRDELRRRELWVPVAVPCQLHCSFANLLRYGGDLSVEAGVGDVIPPAYILHLPQHPGVCTVERFGESFGHYQLGIISVS